MLDVADIVVVNKTDQDRARTAVSEIERRLEQNKREQTLVATVAKRHGDPGVDRLYEILTAADKGAPRKRTRGGKSAPVSR
jgi:methylmalonyl-CoA mutase